MNWQPLYTRLGQKLDRQKPFDFKKGQYIGPYLVCYEKNLEAYTQVLTKADPNAQYLVTDGTHVYHGPAPLEECNQMKKQIGFPTLKVKLWTQPA